LDFSALLLLLFSFFSALRYVNVCADTVAPCQGDQTTSPGVWNYDFKQPYACFGLGQGSSAVWTSASDKISVKYTGGDACYNVQPASTYTLQIDFTCDPNSQTPALTMVGPGATLCDYVGTFTTPLMCSGSFGGGGGGKGAWAFNIAVLAGIPAYFLFGFLINMFAFKKEGSDRIPQLSFWANLPGLVKDGNLYFIYLLRVAFAKCGAGAEPEPFVPSTPTEYGSSSESSGDSSAGSSYSYPAADTPSSGGGGGGYGTI
jgi:hypothetical protein